MCHAARVLLLVAFTACAPDCTGLAGEALAHCVAQRCPAEPAADHDVCLGEALATAGALGDVEPLAVRMVDPVLRDTAVLAWAEHHTLTVVQARPLCRSLRLPGNAEACERRLTTPHLQPQRSL